MITNSGVMHLLACSAYQGPGGYWMLPGKGVKPTAQTLAECCFTFYKDDECGPNNKPLPTAFPKKETALLARVGKHCEKGICHNEWTQ
jgi:hypothetical protein